MAKENAKLTKYVATHLAKKYPSLKGSKVLIYRTLMGSYRHELFPPKGVRVTKTIKEDWEALCEEARLRYGYDKKASKSDKLSKVLTFIDKAIIEGKLYYLKKLEDLLREELLEGEVIVSDKRNKPIESLFIRFLEFGIWENRLPYVSISQGDIRTTYEIGINSLEKFLKGEALDYLQRLPKERVVKIRLLLKNND